MSDLIDSAEVAAILGLRHRNSVTTYSRRYPGFPRPVLVTGRVKLWLRGDVEGWVPESTAKASSGSTSERVRAELIAAAAPLMAERPVSDISVREIASAAGISHTLIYRHFGSKAELQRAVVEQAIAEMVEVVGAMPQDGQAGMERLIAEMQQRQSSLRVLIHALGNPQGAVDFGQSAPVMDALMHRLTTKTSEDGVRLRQQVSRLRPEIAVGAVGALIVGWIAFESRINAATGLDGIPTIELAALCAELLERGSALPHGAAESTGC